MNNVYMCGAAAVIIVVSYLLGLFFRDKGKKGSLALNMAGGFAAMLALFEIVSVPFILLKMSFRYVYSIYAVLLLILSVMAIVKHRKLIKMDCGRFGGIKDKNLWYVPAFFLIALQIMISVMYTHIDDDDAFYVASAVTTVETDTMYQYSAYTGERQEVMPSRYVLSPFPVFTAAVSKLTHVHPTVLAHTVFPGIFIAFCYLVYFLFAELLFEGAKKEKGLFLFFTCVLSIFGYCSVYTSSSFMLLRIWQGKALLAGFLIPYVLYLYMAERGKKNSICKMLRFWSASFAGAMVSSMGIMLLPLIIGGCSIADCMTGKKPKELLYGAVYCLPCILLGGIYLLIK